MALDLVTFSWIPRWTSELTGSSTQYGLIAKEQWVQPDWIDEEKATIIRQKMVADRVIYGGV